MIQSAKHRPPATTAPANGSPPTNGGAAFAPACRGRSSWSGLLRVSLVAVPVNAYAAVSSASSSSHCHMLHADSRCALAITIRSYPWRCLHGGDSRFQRSENRTNHD